MMVVRDGRDRILPVGGPAHGAGETAGTDIPHRAEDVTHRVFLPFTATTREYGPRA